MNLPEKHLKCRALEQEIINNCEECKELTGQYCINEQLRRKQDEEQAIAEEGSVTSLTAKGSCYFSSAMCDQAFEFCRKSYEKCQRKVV